MLKNLALASVAILTLSLSACSSDNSQGLDGPHISQGAFVDEREIVTLISGTKAQKHMQMFASAKGYKLREVTSLRSLGLIMLSFEMPEGTTGKQAIAELEAAISGSTVGVNHAYREQTLNTKTSSLSYANALLNWPKSGCEVSAPIGLIDTQVDAKAAGLSNKQLIQKSFTTGSIGSSRHGTEIASVLADPTRLRNATLYNAAVIEETLDAGRAAGVDSLVRALNWLIEKDIKVVNISLAGPFNKLLDLAIKRAYERGLIMVAAVGNAGPKAAAQYPAAFGSVIAVTAVDADGKIYREASQGPHVDIAAPGVDVLASSAQGARFVTGTSIAVPFVTARIAADPEMFANAGTNRIRERLAANSLNLGRTGPDNTYGSGLMQATGICDR
ncbi:subtilase family protein [Litoreibacter meonggei]|uniref:Subtilase family protein n=2 Tax=Litoreibacter meonggei TaxID=1049199 RepID=A0A497VLE6_9RHOB|nr:subtilase family protein [Litoreibacter meonggei]